MGKRKTDYEKYKHNPYRIKYDHIVDGGYAFIASNKEQAMKKIRRDLARFPYIKASLQQSKKSGMGWKPHSSYEYRKNKKTGKMRLVKI